MCTRSEILKLFNEWKDAIHEGSLDKVMSLYAPDAILLPTLSNKVCHNKAEISEYFVHFLKKKPCCEMEENNLCLHGDIAINAGVYTFTVSHPDGENRVFRARYSFVYQKYGDRWLIIEHHSSKMPEEENG